MSVTLERLLYTSAYFFVIQMWTLDLEQRSTLANLLIDARPVDLGLLFHLVLQQLDLSLVAHGLLTRSLEPETHQLLHHHIIVSLKLSHLPATHISVHRHSDLVNALIFQNVGRVNLSVVVLWKVTFIYKLIVDRLRDLAGQGLDHVAKDLFAELISSWLFISCDLNGALLDVDAVQQL